MNKGELIEATAKDAGISKALAGKVLDSIVETITKTLKRGEKVVLAGFGTFSVAKRQARRGRNPQTGNEIRIPAKKVAKFKVGAKLSKAVK
ncbi:MAG TPA: HU family DNA-binding protein [Syntrophaceae bacterium]|nr:HU family DNA-binding protein [Syntrophaceae bacterium]